MCLNLFLKNNRSPNTYYSYSYLFQIKTFDEYFEICSLVGTLADSGHLHVVLGREDGSTISGHVVGNIKIHTTAEVVIGNCESFNFQRSYDSSTGFNELEICLQN